MKASLKMFLVLMLGVLSACGPGAEVSPTAVDASMVFTAAAKTVAAQLTQTAQAIPPTGTTTFTPTATPTFLSLPTLLVVDTPAISTQSAFSTPTQISLLNTPFGLPAGTSGPLCDNAVFIVDVTYPDGTKVKPEEEFKKIWRIQNTGVCAWDDGYSLVFAYGDSRFNGAGASIDGSAEFTEPGGMLDIGMKMVAPKQAGTYSSCWRMKNDRDVLFGTALCVVIEVSNK